MKRIDPFAIVVCSIVLALCPGAAHAVPVGGAVVLGFGAGYPSGDGVAVHRGVDVACVDGEDVESPLAGEVGFVGRVPSAAGGTMLAVTIATAHGNLTIMPLADTAVTRGQRVDVGQRLGTVSADGDPSSPGVHLHVGLKRAGMYLDPSEVLRKPTSPGQQGTRNAAPSDAAVPNVGGSVAGAPGAALAPLSSPSPAGQSQGALSGGSVMPAGVMLADTARAAGLSAAGEAAMPAGDAVRSAHVPVTAVGAVTRGTPVLQGVGLPAAYAPPASPLSDVADVLMDTLPAASEISPRGAAALVASILSGTALLARRSLRRRVIASSVSDRLGYLLQHLKAGDTLRGLTSCPGPLPSQSRGRIAQGR